MARGYEDGVDAVFCILLASHCVAAEPFSMVKDTIKPAVAAQMLEAAKIKAAQIISEGGARLEKDLIEMARAA